MTPEPAKASVQKAAHRTAVVPKATIQLVCKFINAVFLVPPGKSGDKSYHLIMAQTIFIIILVVAAAGVSLPCPNYAVEYIFAVVPPVKGQVVLFQTLRHGRKDDRVSPLPQHRQHTYAPW